METSAGSESTDRTSLDGDAAMGRATGRADADGECLLQASQNISSLINVIHQRRRVNPESLALRLGPNLVRDLDALITPGNTDMPSFAVRKELQERYCIDRRHIYDYFHSRGLRVVKEDKHGNPVPAKPDPVHVHPLPHLRPLRQAPVKSTRLHPSYAVATERKLLKSRGITKAKPGRPKKNSSTIVPVVCETQESIDTNSSVSGLSPPAATPKLTYVAVNPLLPSDHLPPTVEEGESFTFNSVINPLDESFSVRRAIGDIAYAYRHKVVFERMQELTEHPVKSASADDCSLSWNETSPCFASSKGLLLPHAKPLTRDERRAIYESLSDSIGPVHGIQECQGTYRKHMGARAKLLFEGLLSVPDHHAQRPPETNTILDRKPSLGTNEFRHWLSETRSLKHDGIYGSPRLHPRHRDRNAVKRQDADGMTDGQSRQRSVPQWSQTLDELFPAPRADLYSDNSLADSPIVRTREVARTTVCTDEPSARDWPPFLVTATPSLLTLAVASVGQVRQSGRPRLHGLSGLSGSEEVKVAETDSGSQWSAQASRVTHLEQQPALSDTLRGGWNMSNSARICVAPYSPRNPHIRDLDRIRTRPVTPRDARRRTTSAAGDI